MKTGKMNHRITFQVLKDEEDEYGEAAEWEDFKTVWADIKPVSGKQFFSAKQINAEITHSIYIRYRNDITTNMRIKLKNRIFEVLYLMNVNEENEMLQIYAKEVIS